MKEILLCLIQDKVIKRKFSNLFDKWNSNIFNNKQYLIKNYNHSLFILNNHKEYTIRVTNTKDEIIITVTIKGMFWLSYNNVDIFAINHRVKYCDIYILPHIIELTINIQK